MQKRKIFPLSSFLTLSLFLSFTPFQSALGQAYASAPPAGFCIQNFNMYGPAYANNVPGRTERIAGELRTRTACDVVHLQEVWNASHIEQVADLLQTEYKISAPNRDTRIGLMSLFQHDMKNAETYFYKVNFAGGLLEEIRHLFSVKKAFHVVLADPRFLGEDIYFVNTHLHPTSQALRLAQIFDILEWRLRHADRKMVLTGDFNSDPDSLEHALVTTLLLTEDAYQSANSGYPPGTCTYCSENPRSWLPSDHVFDYVYFSNVGATSSSLVARDATINLRGSSRDTLSDHYGLRINFELKTGYAETDRTALDRRREASHALLSKAQAVFKSALLGDLDSYMAQIKTYQAQIEKSEGLISDYLQR